MEPDDTYSFLVFVGAGFISLSAQKISKSSNGLIASLTGLSLFYLVMILTTYSLYQTDYFKLMMISWVVNIGLVVLITVSLKPGVKHMEAKGI